MSSSTSSRLNRRQLALGAAAAPLAASGLLAAAPRVAAQDKKDVRIVSYIVGEAWDAKVNELFETFNAQSTLANAVVEWRPGEQYWEKLQTEYAGGQAPDITLANSEWIGAGAARGMFVDLNPFFERGDIPLDDLWFDMEPDWGYEGGMYGALLYAGGQAMYVNKALVEAAGESLPAEGWTWDDLLATAQVLTNEAEGQWGFYVDGFNPPHWSCSFIQGAGGSVLNDARDECTLNTAEARAGLQWLVDTMHTHKVSPVPGSLDGPDNPFVAGKVAYMIGGTWVEAALRTTELDWDFVRMPAHPTTGLTSVQLGSNAWSMLSTADDQEAAWEVLAYLGGPIAAEALLTLGVPGFTSVIESPAYQELHAPQNIMAVITDYREFGHDYYATPDAAEWQNAVANEFGPMWSGEDDVENSTQRATDAVNDIFSRRTF
jgi:multiple sugar transport system substrate-binding protein